MSQYASKKKRVVNANSVRNLQNQVRKIYETLRYIILPFNGAGSGVIVWMCESLSTHFILAQMQRRRHNCRNCMTIVRA